MNADQQPAKRELFQVDLKGMVDVLSHHLYSSPTVFVRELLQNAVDAIEARRSQDPSHQGIVRFEVDPTTRTVIVSDNGVGLSQQQITDFVSRVGASSKRSLSADELDRFIGQFGIGLLSCFMVTDELVILTRSIKSDAPSLEWRAKADGSYTIAEIDTELSVGTRVILQLCPEAAEYAEFPRLAGLLRRYGQYLEHDVTVEQTGDEDSLEDTAGEDGLWDYDNDQERALEYAGWELGFQPLDAISIQDAELGLEATAYVLPEAVDPKREGSHRLYLKRMFVTDTDIKVTPRWASFVHCVINSTRLRPTASRESVVEDEVYHATKKTIASSLSDYLHNLASTQRSLLERILSIHDESLRKLACEDDEFFRLVIDLLPFETSRGTVRFGDHRAENTTVWLAPTVDQFRATAAVAAAQKLTVFNGGYTHHAELLERAVALDPSLVLQFVDARTLIEDLSPTELTNRPKIERLITIGNQALAPFGCRVLLKVFEPADIPAVFAEGPEQSLSRSIGTSRDRSEGFWKEVLSVLDEEITAEDRGAFLCLNARCALLENLQHITDPDLLQSTLQVLYVQALLLGRQPLTDEETRTFSDALGAMIRSTTQEDSA